MGGHDSERDDDAGSAHPSSLVSVTGQRRQPRRPGQGASPGTLIVDDAAPKPELTAFVYGAKRWHEAGVERPRELGALLGRESVLWVNVDGLGDTQVVRDIGEVFGLHRLALEDVIYVHQRPKVEEYEGHLFVVARMLAKHEECGSEQLSLFLGSNFVLTFQEAAGDDFEPVRARLRQDGSRLRERGADYLAYCLLDAVIDGYFPVVDRMSVRLDELEREILDEPTGPCLRRLYAIRHDLLLLKRAVLPMREIVNALVREKSPLVSDATRVYLRDCEDHVLQVLDLLDTQREVTHELMEAYRAESSRRMDEVMRVLTVIGTIFLPLTFMVGVYGMNFEGSEWAMPELRWRYGYPLLWIAMLTLVAVMLWMFKRRGWLGRRRSRGG